MSAPTMSPAASGLLSGLGARSGAPREQILLTEIRSTDWQSLTFDGQRHRIGLRITGPFSKTVAERMIDRIEDVEFVIPGIIVADVHVAEAPSRQHDGTTALVIEALTLVAD
jgi:hypothetical protein